MLDLNGKDGMADHSAGLRHKRIHFAVGSYDVTKPITGSLTTNAPFFRTAVTWRGFIVYPF